MATAKYDSIPTTETGTISSGTLRGVDLIATYASFIRAHCEQHGLTLPVTLKAHEKDVLVAEEASYMTGGDSEFVEQRLLGYGIENESEGYELLHWLVIELTDLMADLAPEGYYFGTSEGDGAEFGYWEVEE